MSALDASGDSDELQALFDSLSGANAAPVAAPVPVAPPPVAVTPVNVTGDCAELQDLFDSVANEYEAPPAQLADEPVSGEPHDVMFTRIGKLTRRLHDTLQELGYEQKLEATAKAIPDARQRLAYIAQMTEQAASKVLNATDIAQPLQDAMAASATNLQDRWNQLFAGQLNADGFRSLVMETRGFLGTVTQNTQQTNAQLMEIMMAQDFQDLTGQVIKKVVEMAQRLETELLRVLIETMPDEMRAEAPEGLLNGPVISAEGRDDVVTNQEQVDDLLESLGF